MEFFRYSAPLDYSVISQSFKDTLGSFEMSIPEDRFVSLFTPLREHIEENKALSEPFPLLTSSVVAHKHVKKLKKALGGKAGPSLGKCQQAFASFYNFPKWDFLTKAIDEFDPSESPSPKDSTRKPFLIEQHWKWPHLLRALGTTERFKPYSSVTAQTLIFGLAPAAAIAGWIWHFAPELAEREELKILVVGAEIADALDDGRWYNFIPDLLSRDFRIKTTLLGDELSPEKTPLPSQVAAELSKLPQASLCYGELDEYFESRSADDFDLMVFFQPGFEGDHRAIRGGSITRALNSGVKVMVSSYAEVEAFMESLVLHSFGFMGSKIVSNPFHIDNTAHLPDVADGTSLWGGFLYDIPEPPPAEFFVDEKTIETIESISDLFGMIHASEPLFDPQMIGEMFSRDGMDFIYLTPSIYIEPKKQLIYLWPTEFKFGSPLPNLTVPDDLYEAVTSNEDHYLSRLMPAAILLQRVHATRPNDHIAAISANF